MAYDATLKTEFLVQDEASLRSIFPPTHVHAADKCMDHLDKHAKDYLARSPFMCISSQSDSGQADISPKGDPRGFVKILDEKTLLIPDRPGNNRLDTLTNILSNPSVGLIFMIPGYDETMRVNGKAKISRDPSLLSMLTVKDRAPTVAIIVEISEVFLHCAKAFRRSKLWDPAQLQDRSEMPSLINIVLDQTTGAPNDPKELDKLDADLEDEYQKTMY